MSNDDDDDDDVTSITLSSYVPRFPVILPVATKQADSSQYDASRGTKDLKLRTGSVLLGTELKCQRWYIDMRGVYSGRRSDHFQRFKSVHLHRLP